MWNNRRRSNTTGQNHQPYPYQDQRNGGYPMHPGAYPLRSSNGQNYPNGNGNQYPHQYGHQQPELNFHKKQSPEVPPMRISQHNPQWHDVSWQKKV